MTSRLIFSAEAAEDVVGAREWYDEREAGLANRFLDELDACCYLIKSHPTAFGKVHRGYRGTCLKRFPYVVVYSVQPNGVYVVGVMHTSHGPETWRSRFG